MSSYPKIFLTLFFCLFCAPRQEQALSAEASVDYDTTRVREVQPVKKNLGEKLIDVPGELLKLPIYTLEFITKTVVLTPPMTKVFSLLQKHEKKSTYVPVVGYSTRAGVKLGFGINFLNRETSGSRLKLKSYYSTNRYQLYRLRFTSPQFFSSRIGLKVSALYRKETRQSFYGFGMNTFEGAEVNLSRENSILEMQLPVQIDKALSVSMYARSQITNVFDGSDPDLEGRLIAISNDPSLGVTPGRLEGLRHMDIGVALELDGRNNTGRPTSGSHLLGNYEHIFGVGRSDGRDFDAFNIDLRHYIHIWRKRVLALRTSFSRIAATSSNPRAIPYYLANRLGGIETLRGYTSGRFVGNDAAYVSLEYRYPIYNNVAAFLFWDEGRVYDDVIKEVVFKNWRKSLGVGIRVFNNKRALAEIQIARSDESVRFYFDLGATW